jgi:hypothetical protein
MKKLGSTIVKFEDAVSECIEAIEEAIAANGIDGTRVLSHFRGVASKGAHQPISPLHLLWRFRDDRSPVSGPLVDELASVMRVLSGRYPRP